MRKHNWFVLELVALLALPELVEGNVGFDRLSPRSAVGSSLPRSGFYRWMGNWLFLASFVVLGVTPAHAASWIATGSMATARYYHTATLLANGKVLVAGGDGADSAELYNPSTGTWTATGSMVAACFSCPATLLANGKVLVAGGGDDGVGAELYNPSTGTWTATGSMAARYYYIATLLANGKVLVGGGGDDGVGAELYNPSTGTWTATGSMVAARSGSGHTATLLANGKVLVAGGWNGSYLDSAELYDPSTGTWTATGSMVAARLSHTATLLANGKVLVAGGVITTVPVPSCTTPALVPGRPPGLWPKCVSATPLPCWPMARC